MTTEVDPQDYPPYKMTPSQEAATVGRYREDLVAAPVPQLTVTAPELKAGRTPAAPPGTVFTGNVYEEPSDEAISPHVASVAAFSEAVRSSVPDAHPNPDDPEVQAAAAALEADSYDQTREEIVAEAAEAKALDEVEAAEATEARAAEAEAAGAEVPDLEEASDAKNADAAEAEAKAERAEEAAAADVEIGQDTDNAEPASAVPDWNDYTVAQLRTELGRRGIDYEYSARKADLIALLESPR